MGLCHVVGVLRCSQPIWSQEQGQLGQQKLERRREGGGGLKRGSVRVTFEALYAGLVLSDGELKLATGLLQMLLQLLVLPPQLGHSLIALFTTTTLLSLLGRRAWKSSQVCHKSYCTFIL